jgi:CheY-like chemotaxis protein
MSAILIVDDDPSIRMIATELLRSSDHAVLEAADGVEALKIVAAVPIDLVVLDMLMPNKDGLETILALRESHPHIRIVAISSGGRADPADYLKTAMLFGADATLVKPLCLATFALVVDEVLNRPDARSDPLATATAD